MRHFIMVRVVIFELCVHDMSNITGLKEIEKESPLLHFQVLHQDVLAAFSSGLQVKSLSGRFSMRELI